MTGEGSLFVPPAAIGRFRVLHQIGAGTCGPVFRATDPTTDRAVAIKLFTLSLTPERAATLAARLERLASAALPLAGAVSPLAAGDHGHTPYLVTALASGDSLDVALRQFGPAALEDLVPRLRALAGALDAAAARGILHGALHPRDVIVSEQDTAVTGLGVWPILSESGVRLPVRRPYRAPDLADTSISAAGDQFALAALAYEWMTGRRAPAPFGPADMAPLPGADRDRLADVFARALSDSPDQRYPACAAFVSDVAEVAADAEVPVPRAGSRSRRRTRPAPTPSLEEFPAQPSHGALPFEPVADDVVPAESDVDPSLAPDDAEADLPTAHQSADSDVDGPDVLLVPGARPSRALDEVSEAGDVPIRSSESSMFADAPSRSVTGGMGRLAAATALGLALGLGFGYAAWGGAETGEVAPASTAGSTPAEVPPAEPTTTPAAPSTSVPESPAPPDERLPGIEREASPGPAAMGEPSPGTAPPPPPARAPAPTAASLLVRSTPAGATVFVDGERKGVTPLAIRDLPIGTRSVRVQRDGYATEPLQVTLTRDRPSRSVDVRLRPQAAAPGPAATEGVKTGTLLIDSRPSGATASVNGRSVGLTPLTIEDLAPGSYTVRLQLAGFRPFTTTVRVVAGARARAAGSLTGAQEPK